MIYRAQLSYPIEEFLINFDFYPPIESLSRLGVKFIPSRVVTHDPFHKNS